MTRLIRQWETWDDFQIGDTMTTYGRTVTEADVVNYQCLIGAFASGVHTDAEMARNTVFGQRVASALHITVLGIGMAVSCRFWGPCFVAFMGLDSLRAHRPVFIGDTVTCTVEVADKRVTHNPERGLVHHRVSIANQTGEEVVSCLYTILVEVRR